MDAIHNGMEILNHKLGSNFTNDWAKFLDAEEDAEWILKEEIGIEHAGRVFILIQGQVHNKTITYLLLFFSAYT